MKKSVVAKLFPGIFCGGFLVLGCQSPTPQTQNPLSKTSASATSSAVEAGLPPLPRFPTKPEILLDHHYFKVSYNEEHRLPNWVSYQLARRNLRQVQAKSKTAFFSDMALIKMRTPYAKPQDFDAALYDWGALAPAEDFSWSPEAHNATFVMSNITPQKKKLHRGVWKPLENKVRKWACTEESLKIISGPILDKSLKKFMSKVSIPKKFFKIIIDETPPRKAIAFVLDQEDTQWPPEQRALSMAEAEKMAGFLFLGETGLPKQEYAKIRTTFNLADWTETECTPKVGVR